MDSSSYMRVIKDHQKNIYRVFKINLNYRCDILNIGIDPLGFLFKLYEVGDIIESNTNVSRLPNLLELDASVFYLSWTLLLKSKASRVEIENILNPSGNNDEIIVEEYSEDYLSYSREAMMESRIGEVLIEKGLITEDEISKALKIQKKLGEILVEKGLITQDEINKALGVQRKLGEILIDEGKIMPNKVEAIIEQQNQVRKFREMNSVRVDATKYDNLIGLVNELKINKKRVAELTDKKESMNFNELSLTVEIIDKIIMELHEQLINIKMVDKSNVQTRIKGVLVKVGEQTYVIPHLTVIDSIKLQGEFFKAVDIVSEPIRVKGVNMPLIWLHKLFNVKTINKVSNEALGIIVGTDSLKACLLVDDIIGQQQIVLEMVSEKTNFAEGILGEAISEDGLVVRILDVPRLIIKVIG